MRQIEQWVEWKPDFGDKLFANYCVESIHDIVDDYYIILASVQDLTKKIKILYVDSVEAYRRTDAFLRKRSLAIFEGPTKNFAVYRVENSCYAKWLSEESYGFVESKDFVHLVFVGENCVVDVVARYEPKIIYID